MAFIERINVISDASAHWPTNMSTSWSLLVQWEYFIRFREINTSGLYHLRYKQSRFRKSNYHDQRSCGYCTTRLNCTNSPTAKNCKKVQNIARPQRSARDSRSVAMQNSTHLCWFFGLWSYFIRLNKKRGRTPKKLVPKRGLPRFSAPHLFSE